LGILSFGHAEDNDGLPAFLERYTRVADGFSD
jgi:hypothetical protein